MLTHMRTYSRNLIEKLQMPVVERLAIGSQC